MLHFMRASTPRGISLLLHARHLLKCPAELGPCHRNTRTPPTSLRLWLLAVWSMLVREKNQKMLCVWILGCVRKHRVVTYMHMCVYIYIQTYTHIYLFLYSPLRLGDFFLLRLRRNSQNSMWTLKHISQFNKRENALISQKSPFCFQVGPCTTS